MIILYPTANEELIQAADSPTHNGKDKLTTENSMNRIYPGIGVSGLQQMPMKFFSVNCPVVNDA